MASSKTEIANMALALINEPSIQNFEQASTPAERVIKLFFDQTFEEVCAEFPWNFCTKSDELAETESIPIGWTNSFAIPNTPKTLRILSIEKVGTTDPDWERQGNELLINAGTCFVKRSYRVEDINLVPAHVVRCIYTLLASRIAVPLLGVEGQSLGGYYQNVYTTETRPNAQLLDANEGKNPVIEESTVMGVTFINGESSGSGANVNYYVDAPEQPYSY
jgi:hypothetical protein